MPKQANSSRTRHETLDLVVSASAPRTFTIFGDVRDAATGRVLPDVAVIAAFRSEQSTVLTQSSRSGDNGAFRIAFDQGLFTDPSRPITVTFELSQDGQPLHTDTTIARLEPQDQKVEVRASRPVPAEAALVVRGTVRDGQGRPLAGLRVDARDRDLRSEQPLGQADTDAAGAYRIPYAAESILRAERGTADLVVRVLNDDHEPYVARAETEAGQPLPSFRLRSPEEPETQADTQVLVNAPADAVINLVVTDARLRSPSEYERYLEALHPLIENTPVADLADGELAFLATETGLPPERLNLLGAAERLGRDTKLAATLFYGLFRQGLGPTLTQLLMDAPEDRRRALEASLRDGIIPPMTDAEIDRALAALDDLLIAQAAGDLPSAEPSPLGDLLATAAPDAAVRIRFARAYAAYDGKDTEGFWRDVAAIPEIGAERAQDLRFSFQVAQLSGNHLPLIKAVQGERGLGGWEWPEDLVRLDEDGWTAIIHSQVDNAPAGVPADIPGVDDEKRTQNYARMLDGDDGGSVPHPGPCRAGGADAEGTISAPCRRSSPTTPTSTSPAPRSAASSQKGRPRSNRRQRPGCLHRPDCRGATGPEGCSASPATRSRSRRRASNSARAIHLLGPEAFTLQFSDTFGGMETARLAYARAEKQSAMSQALSPNIILNSMWINPIVIPHCIPWMKKTGEILPQCPGDIARTVRLTRLLSVRAVSVNVQPRRLPRRLPEVPRRCPALPETDSASTTACSMPA